MSTVHVKENAWKVKQLLFSHMLVSENLVNGTVQEMNLHTSKSLVERDTRID